MGSPATSSFFGELPDNVGFSKNFCFGHFFFEQFSAKPHPCPPLIHPMIIVLSSVILIPAWCEWICICCKQQWICPFSSRFEAHGKNFVIKKLHY